MMMGIVPFRYILGKFLEGKRVWKAGIITSSSSSFCIFLWFTKHFQVYSLISLWHIPEGSIGGQDTEVIENVIKTRQHDFDYG